MRKNPAKRHTVAVGPPALRDQFQRIVGTSPGRYRRTFRQTPAERV